MNHKDKTKSRSSAPTYTPYVVRLPDDMYAEAKRKAAEQGISMQKFIRMAVAGITGVPDRSRHWTPPGSDKT